MISGFDGEDSVDSWQYQSLSVSSPLSHKF